MNALDLLKYDHDRIDDLIDRFEASQSLSIWHILTYWHSMTLPIATLTLISVAGFSRYMRSTSIDTLAQDYIKAARAKGLPERLVLTRHLLRNACLPMVTLIGLSIPFLLSGNLITESVFNYPCLGLLFLQSLNNVDYNALLAYTLAGAILTVISPGRAPARYGRSSTKKPSHGRNAAFVPTGSAASMGKAGTAPSAEPVGDTAVPAPARPIRMWPRCR